MSDHPKEAERNLKRIYICNDIYYDVFRLLTPAKVGLELALVSDTFDAMVDTHLKSRKWTLVKLGIRSNTLTKLNGDGSEGILPFPQKPLPNSIVGFACVNLRSIDSGAITFLQSIGRLFESGFCLSTDIDTRFNWNNFATSVWPLLNVSAIIKIHFGWPWDFQNFRLFISPSILCDCTNLRVITFYFCVSLQFTTDDSKELSDGQALCKWLHTPRADGQPKVIGYGLPFPIDALKTIFLGATTSVSFIIRLYSVHHDVGPFELMINSLTREQLTCRKIDNPDCLWLIERSPIDKNAKQWTKWEKEALEEDENDWKVLRMCRFEF